MNVVVAQKGAREHFLAARALHRRGMLAGLVTDWYAFREGQQDHETTGLRDREALVGGQKSVVSGPVVGCPICQLFSFSACQRFGRRSALAARADGIPDELVHAFPVRSLFWKWRVRRLRAGGRNYEAYLETDAAFASAVARLKLPPHDVFFGYSYASLEMLELEKKQGVLTVLDQIDPGPAHFRIVADEMSRHPELDGDAPRFPQDYYNRVRREWDIADVIIVNSDWSREAIVAEGADPAKTEILPLAFETKAENLKAESENLQPSTLNLQPSTAPLRVLFLGQVNVGKGIHYLLEAAKLLEREAVEFLVAGPLGIRKEAMASAPKNVKWLGPIPRSQTTELYGESDVFVLPTLSDGFAITQLEALAHGLPVIVTPNCGRVVQDGVTGFVIPPRDSQALAGAILKFVHNQNLVVEMSPRCVESSKAYSIAAYGQKLVGLIEKHIANRNH